MLQFLPREKPAFMCPTCGDEPGMEGFQGGDTVDISEEFLPYAAAHAAWTDCMACGACIYGLDIGIGSVSPDKQAVFTPTTSLSCADQICPRRIAAFRVQATKGSSVLRPRKPL